MSALDDAFDVNWKIMKLLRKIAKEFALYVQCKFDGVSWMGHMSTFVH